MVVDKGAAVGGIAHERYPGGVTVDRTRTSERTCPGCGATFRRFKGESTGHCPTCSVARVGEAARQAKAKSGPTYERMVAASLRHWHGEAVRLGLPVPVAPSRDV